MQDLAERYLDVWNEGDPVARRAAIDALFTEDVRMVDPLADVEGQEALNTLIGSVRAQLPGFVFAPAGPVDAHHDQARFTWQASTAGAEPVAIGFDVVVFAPDGRIRNVYGFLDKSPV